MTTHYQPEFTTVPCPIWVFFALAGCELTIVFDDVEIDTLLGDQFYLFTDGLPNQFGGPQTKKFTSVRLRDLLLEHHELPIMKQQKALMRTLHHWQGREEQIDDILVAGIRL